GGVEGFIRWVSARLENKKESRKTVQFYAWLISVIIFVETSISILTVGAIFRPLFDRFRIAREKLAYITDSGSAPACIIFPLNGWGAFIMGLLAAQQIDQPFITMLKAIPFNFYALLALIAVPLVIFFNLDIPVMKRAEERTQAGKLMWDDSRPLISDDVLATKMAPGIEPKSSNMVLPILVMILAMPAILLYTGWENIPPELSFFEKILLAIGNGSGSKAVLVAVTLAIVTAMTLYKIQGIMGIRENFDWIIKG